MKKRPRSPCYSSRKKVCCASLPRTSAQFSSVLVWPDDLADRLLYAKYRRDLAGAGADPHRLAARSGGRAASCADTAFLDFWRRLCRSLAQTARLACDPSSSHDPGSSPLGADRDRHSTSLASVCPGAAAGAHEQPG